MVIIRQPIKAVLKFSEMKKFTLTAILVISLSACLYAQRTYRQNNDSVFSNIQNILNGIEMRIINSELGNRFELYPTKNIYNFLRLDRVTGQIEQIQWSTDKYNELSVPVNTENLSLSSTSFFELYPTDNIYQFILMDKSNGRTWHVQWGMERADRWIRRIF